MSPTPPPPDLPGRAFPAIARQRLLATSAQLRDHGWTGDAIRHARDRRIQAVFPGVFAAHRGPLDADDRLVAAYLWAGEHAVLTGRVALQRHGLDVPSNGWCLFLVPSTCRARSVEGLRTLRTTRAVAVQAYRECVPLTSVARALCDAADHQGLTGRALAAVTLSALQRRLTHADLLRDELAQRRPTKATAALDQALRHFAAGAWSLPEASLAEHVRRDPGLPEYLQNVELWTTGGARIGCPDGYFPGSGVAPQVHSRAYHEGYDEQGKDRWSATVEKDGPFVEHGIIVVPITPASIERRADQVLRRLRQTVARYAGRDLSHIVVKDRSTKPPTAA